MYSKQDSRDPEIGESGEPSYQSHSLNLTIHGRPSLCIRLKKPMLVMHMR